MSIPTFVILFDYLPILYVLHSHLARPWICSHYIFHVFQHTMLYFYHSTIRTLPRGWMTLYRIPCRRQWKVLWRCSSCHWRHSLTTTEHSTGLATKSRRRYGMNLPGLSWISYPPRQHIRVWVSGDKLKGLVCNERNTKPGILIMNKVHSQE